MIPFWRRVVDEKCGGYQLNHDATGYWRGPSEKVLVTQARTLWFFARLTRAGLAGPGPAANGYQFMRDRMWDKAHGGFYWAVNHDGTRPTKPGKHVYGQAFALYALCEHAQATGDPEVAELCLTLFTLLDARAHDDAYGGYREAFTVDWQAPPPSDVSYMGTPPDTKLFNTHLHVLEALTSLVGLRDDEAPQRRRLAELITICSETVVDKNTGGCRDVFRQDWTPMRGCAYDRASYGHDLENVALLRCAAAALGVPGGALLRRCRAIAVHALMCGRDVDRGGFYAGGPLGQPADRREKVYWTQAEALFGLLHMWQATGDEVYLEALAHTLDWVDEQQVDRDGGDWHATITPDGVRQGNKADQWKDPYHQTRALLELVALADENDSQRRWL